MAHSIRFFLVAIALATGFSIAASERASAAQQQSALHFHKAKYFMDQNGQPWLSVQFVNEGNTAIKVDAIAPDRNGPWTKINENVAPSAKVRGAVKIVKDTPASVWVDSSVGMLEFDIAPRK